MASRSVGKPGWRVVTMALLAVIVPAVVAAGVIALGRFGPWWKASAVGLGYIAGHAAVAWPKFPPVEVTDRIPWLALAAAVLAVFEALRAPGPIIRFVGRLLLWGLIVVLILGPVERTLGVVVSGIVVALFMGCLEALEANPRGPDVVRGVVISAAGAAVVLLISGSAVLGFLGAAISSAVGVSWLAGRGKPPVGGSVLTAEAVLAALVLEGTIYASLPVASALLLAVAPAAVWIGRLGPVQRLGPRASAVVGTIVVVIPVAIAVGLAISESPGNEY